MIELVKLKKTKGKGAFMNLSSNLKENIKNIEARLPVKESFDLISRKLFFGEIEAYMIFLDGFAKDMILLRMIQDLQNKNFEKISDFHKWIDSNIPYIEIDTFQDFDSMIQAVLSGATVIVVDGQSEGIIVDSRTYPARGPEEPELEKVTRGSRDGLVETIIFNTALIRRRIRDPKLVFEMKTVGKRTKTDVVISFIKDLADEALLETLRKKIDEIEIDSLVMAEKSLEELIIKKKWYNPMPQARFTERPDVAAAHLLEGHIVIIVDTSPSAIIVPATFFHFTQHSEDYYQNPAVGTYIRWVRFFSILISMVLTPLYLVMIYNQQNLPDFLLFMIPKEDASIPIFVQLFFLELGLDILRIASIHTPSALSTSLAIIGGLMLSSLAVDVGWVTKEAVLYMALVGIGTFANPSLEFALAVRMFRLVTLVLTGIFKTTGFMIGIIFMVVVISTTNSIGNVKYTWPLIPFNGKALSNVIFRRPILEIKRNKK
ncbi:MAG: spore germination protein [Clostridia bacterium]|nr:spore germination protein [Clostridia bacterium]